MNFCIFSDLIFRDIIDYFIDLIYYFRYIISVNVFREVLVNLLLRFNIFFFLDDVKDVDFLFDEVIYNSN